MAIPSTPSNLIVQQGNGEVLISWDISSTATSYPIQRSLDGVTFSSLTTVSGSPLNTFYLDQSVTVGVKYWYKVAATNTDGTSAYTSSASIIPAKTGLLSLGQIRQMAQQRADRVNSSFVSTAEWNTYINQSAYELYDLLVNTFEDYYTTTPYTFTTDGTTSQYSLPPNFDKLVGVDLALNATSNAYVTIQKFDFISRNRYVYPNITSTFAGVFNLRYRLVGSTLMFIPTPSAGQQVRVWYIPRMTQLLKDTDQLDGVSGWIEYVIVDAAIKALQKEESDVQVLMAQKMALIKRIEESAMNRDAGQPDTISSTRAWGNSGGGWGNDGGYGGI